MKGSDLPQLVIIDGGKGQLSSAMKSLDKTGTEGKDNSNRNSKKT